MKEAKRALKKSHIISTAERVFAKLGFKNAKMEDIAMECGITKVTLYTYFQSKENLYAAMTYEALTSLISGYDKIISAHKNEVGLNSSLALIEYFMEFCENNSLYADALMDHFSIIRSGKLKMTEAIKESEFFKKSEEIQTRPFKLVVQEIQRGIEDGSIKEEIDPMVATLVAWSSGIGYAKIIAASGDTSLFFNISLKELKTNNIEIAKGLLTK